MKLARSFACVALLFAAACGDSEKDQGDDTNTANGGGGPGPSGNVVTTQDAVTGACDGMAMAGGAECDTTAYVECSQTECAAGYKTCLGPKYESGDFSGGKCEALMQCVAKSADKCDNNCTPDATCEQCLADEVAGCVLSKCLSKLDCGAGGEIPDINVEGGCKELEACCGSLPAAEKDMCSQLLAGTQAGGDLACGLALTSYTAAGKCK